MSKKLNVAKSSSGISKHHHIVRDENYALLVCNTVEKTSCPSHYLDVKANSFQSTRIYPFQPVVFRDHDFALNHKDIESILQFDKNKHPHLLHHLTSLLVQISEAPVHLVHNFLQMFCLIGDRITVQTNCDSALRICLRKLLGRTVDRLLQREDYGKRKGSKYHQVQVVRKKKEDNGDGDSDDENVQRLHCNKYFQKTRRERGALQKVFLLVLLRSVLLTP